MAVFEDLADFSEADPEVGLFREHVEHRKSRREAHGLKVDEEKKALRDIGGFGHVPRRKGPG